MHDFDVRNSYAEHEAVRLRAVHAMDCRYVTNRPCATNRYYEYRHVVDLEETDLTGNVYDVNCARWQGRCREMFLLEYAPSVLDELREGLELVTIAAECERLADIQAFDDLSIRMSLVDLGWTQITLAFDYVRVDEGREQLVAIGRHLVASMNRGDRSFTPVPVPEHLRIALEQYSFRSEPPLARAPLRSGTGGRA